MTPRWQAQTVPARSGMACQLRAGSLLRVVDVEGGQSGDIVFMNVAVGPDGGLTIRPPVSTAGQSLTFSAERDVLVAVAACSAPGANGGRTRPLVVELGTAT